MHSQIHVSSWSLLKHLQTSSVWMHGKYADRLVLPLHSPIPSGQARLHPQSLIKHKETHTQWCIFVPKLVCFACKIIHEGTQTQAHAQAHTQWCICVLKNLPAGQTTSTKCCYRTNTSGFAVVLHCLHTSLHSPCPTLAWAEFPVTVTSYPFTAISFMVRPTCLP